MTIYTILLALTGLLPLGLAVYAWPKRAEPAVSPFILAAAAGASWPLLLLVEMALPGVEWKSLVVRVRPTLILTAVSAFLVMALRHGGWSGSTRLAFAVLSPMPVLNLLFNFLPPARGWFQHSFRLHPEIPSVLAFDNGAWGSVYTIYTPLLSFSVMALLLAQAWQQQGLYRRRSLVLAFGISAPTLLYVMQLSGLTAWTPYNLPPLGMAVTGLCGAWVLLWEQYFDLTPVARATLFDQWPHPLLVVNPRHEVVDANPAARQIMGASVGAPLSSLTPPWDAELADYDGKALRRGELVCGDSNYSWEARPLSDDAGRWRGWVWVVDDTTERARARAALEALNLELKAEIQQRRATEARLIETHRIETVGRLSGGVAHEFNNLTMIINGYANLLLARLPEEDPNRPAIEAIAQAGDDAARLTAQLLEFSRKQVMRAGLVNVRLLLREARHMWATLLGERIRLRFAAVDEAPPVWISADGAKLREALSQLILNARDSMNGGGVVTITVETLHLAPGALLRTADLAAGEYVRISIADTGIGMDKSTLARALDPFFSTKGVGQGSGLGLSSAYGIARQFGGTIELESLPGAGTTALLYLPLAPPPPESEAMAASSAPADPGRPTRILVVEDQPDVRRLLRALIEADGHVVEEAAGAAAALQILESPDGPPDLLITDLVMPGLSGYELIERARRLHPDLPVLVISGHSDEESPASAGYLRKPFTAEQLSREVARLRRGA
jgi:signal transduction histidine kinase